MLTHYLPSNSDPSPGLLSRPSRAPAQAIAAWAGTVVLISTAKPRVPDGRKPVIAGTGSRRGYMSLDPLAGPTLCRCVVCASRRAAQLAQALQNKFGPGATRRRIH
jgi:hypothetical protein